MRHAERLNEHLAKGHISHEILKEGGRGLEQTFSFIMTMSTSSAINLTSGS